MAEGITKQERWQKKMRDQGRCTICGKRSGGAVRCEPCALKRKEAYYKQRYGDDIQLRGATEEES